MHRKMPVRFWNTLSISRRITPAASIPIRILRINIVTDSPGPCACHGPFGPRHHETPASFGHLMGGYDAGYSSSLWSKVYAPGITETFRRDGMTNRTTGMRFRQEILSQGTIQDGGVLLKNFLGREPGVGALYKRLGISSPAGTRGS